LITKLLVSGRLAGADKAKARWIFIQRVVLAAPVRLELTTHGLTGLYRLFFKTLNPFILKAFSVCEFFTPKSRPNFLT
jgi:hypothetical protein